MALKEPESSNKYVKMLISQALNFVDVFDECL